VKPRYPVPGPTRSAREIYADILATQAAPPRGVVDLPVWAEWHRHVATLWRELVECQDVAQLPDYAVDALRYRAEDEKVKGELADMGDWDDGNHRTPDEIYTDLYGLVHGLLPDDMAERIQHFQDIAMLWRELRKTAERRGLPSWALAALGMCAAEAEHSADCWERQIRRAGGAR
jgi:hypothetical protein